MAVVAQVAIAADQFELGDILSTDATIEIELTQFVPINTDLIPYIWVESTDVAVFESKIRSDSRVDTLTRHDQRAERTLYHVEWATALDGFLGLIEDHDLLVERGHGTGEEWTFQFRLPNISSFRTFYSDCQDENVPLRVCWISGADIQTERGDTLPVQNGRVADSDLLRQDERTAISPTSERERPLGSAREEMILFRQFIENLDEVVWMSDPNKENMTYVNPAYEEVWGRPREELYKEPLSFLEAVHPDDRERVRTALESQSEGGYDEEYRLEQPDGTVRWIRDRAVSIRNNNGDVSHVAGIAEDITNRKQREQELAQTSQTLEALTTSFPDLAFIIDENGYYREYLAGSDTEPLLYGQPQDFLGAQLHDVLPADVADRIHSVIQRSLDTAELQRIEYQLDVPAGSRWFEGRVAPMQSSPTDTQSVVFVARDITQRQTRERMLTGINDATQRLFQAASIEEIADLAVQTASQRLQLSLVCLYIFDESTGVLRPTAQTPDINQILGDPPTFSGSGSLVWDAFVNGETRVYDDVRTQGLVYDAETPIRSELIVPLGDYGVLLAGNTTTDAFDEIEIEFAELLATNVVAAADHIEYERDLERQNEQLVDISRLNDVIRNINRAVVDATTREEIAAKVCEDILETEHYRAAWVGEYRTDQEATVHATAGPVEGAVESEGNDRISVEQTSLMDRLVGTADDTRAVHVMQDLRDESNVDSFHKQLVDHGCRSAVAVPLTAGEANYGVLTVYTATSGAFDEEEVTILRELGQTIGRAIRAVETRRALVAETATELEFEVLDETSFFVAASATLECRISLEGLVPLEAGRLLYYVRVDDAPAEAFRELAADAATIETCRLIHEDEEGGTFELRVSGASAVLTIVDFGATVHKAVAEQGNAHVTAEITSDTDVRTLLNSLQKVCPSANLIGKRELDRPVQTVHQFREKLAEQLTEKQRNALQAAYFGGYFEWPRDSSAEDIAAPMEVSSSTFHFHLRHATKKLLVAFFEATYED